MSLLASASCFSYVNWQDYANQEAQIQRDFQQQELNNQLRQLNNNLNPNPFGNGNGSYAAQQHNRRLMNEYNRALRGW